MRHLIVVGFNGRHNASIVLRELLQTSYDGSIDVIDAVAAYRTDDGALRIDDSVQRTIKEGAGWGAVLGVLLGSLIALPFAPGIGIAAAATVGLEVLSSGVVGAAVGAKRADVSKRKHGISDEFVLEVGNRILPGHSAVFTVLEAKDPGRVIEAFRAHGGWILHSTLSSEEPQREQDRLET